MSVEIRKQRGFPQATRLRRISHRPDGGNASQSTYFWAAAIHLKAGDFLSKEWGDPPARLDKGRLPLDQALEYAIQIADALDKAHRQGVVHRDLKPGNIMITKSGTKLLDFGLAKLKARSAPLNQWSTIEEKEPLTTEGTILGTLQYMAPEQLEGKEADARTDIFAFGAVVYEMVTDKKAFVGASQASLIHAIMGVDPQLITDLQPSSSPLLDHVVTACLAKSPDDRCQSAADLMRELTWTASTPDPEPPETRTGTRERVGWALFAAATIAVVLLILPGGEGPPAQVVRSEYVLPIKRQLGVTGANPTVVVSPVGSSFAYSMFPASGLLLRPFDAVGMRSIADEPVLSPVFSPDGLWVAYARRERLFKVPITGGTPVPIPVPQALGGMTWGEGDTFVFAPENQSSLWMVSDDGGEPKELTTLADGETGHRMPKFLPGGRAVLFTVWTEQQSRDGGQIAVYSFDDDTKKILLPGTQPQYAPTGHLVYAQGDRVLAVGFDVARLETTGTPVPVLENVLQGRRGISQFSFSDTGLMMYVPADVAEPQYRLVWVDRQGRTEPVRDVAFGPHVKPRLSPEGNRIASFFTGRSAFDIWVYDLVTGILQPVTLDGYRSSNMLPLWTPDGAGLTFERIGSLGGDIYTMPVDETGEMEELTVSDGTDIPVSYSPDGTLAFTGTREGIGTGIFVLLPDGEVQDFLVTPQGETSPMFSPNGRFIAYVSDESGQNEVYVRPFPPRPGGQRKVSSNGGTEPVWARDGGEIYYRNGDRMMAAEIATGPFEVVGRTELFVDRFFKDNIDTPSYDVDSNGRFLMFEEDPDDSVRVILVQNWFEDLKRLVPTDNNQ